MDYSYSATGGISIGGCAPSLEGLFYTIRYPVGSVVCLKPKAEVGIIEKLFIKSVRYAHTGVYNDPFGGRPKRLGNYPPMYIDNMNAHYNERELCEEDEAREIASAYKIAYAAEVERITREDC